MKNFKLLICICAILLNFTSCDSDVYSEYTSQESGISNQKELIDRLNNLTLLYGGSIKITNPQKIKKEDVDKLEEWLKETKQYNISCIITQHNGISTSFSQERHLRLNSIKRTKSVAEETPPITGGYNKLIFAVEITKIEDNKYEATCEVSDNKAKFYKCICDNTKATYSDPVLTFSTKATVYISIGHGYEYTTPYNIEGYYDYSKKEGELTISAA